MLDAELLSYFTCRCKWRQQTAIDRRRYSAKERISKIQ